jgi:rubrerythrin
MELGTFGAIVSFALAWEQRAAAFYAQSARGALSERFEELAAGSRKRAERVERARREGVSEMILESIVGLDGDDYEVDLEVETTHASRIRQALALEAVSARFYRDAAAKLPIREVARLFRRLAKENERRQVLLSSETDTASQGR